MQRGLLQMEHSRNRRLHRRRCFFFGLSLAVIAAIFLVLLLVGRTGSEEKIRVGIVMSGSSDEDGWNKKQYSGVQAACKKLGSQLFVKEGIEEEETACAQAVDELASEGAQMIILNSYGYTKLMKKSVQKYPDISFFGTAAELEEDNFSSYFSRMYQARYLAGIVAGMTTRTGKIGYVAAMSNSEVNRGISAFARGVRRGNKDAEVIVSFTGSWNDAGIERKLARSLIEKESVDVLTYHQNQSNVVDVAEEAGIASIGYNDKLTGKSDNYLTAAVCNWEVLYETIIRKHMKGRANEKKCYWMGLESNVVGLDTFSSRVTPEIREEVEKARQEILDGQDVFTGLIYDHNGKKRCDAGESISDASLLEHFDWLVEGVRIHEEN